MKWTEHEDPELTAIADRLNHGGGFVDAGAFKIVRSSGRCFRPGDKESGIDNYAFFPSTDGRRPAKTEPGEPNGVLGVWELYRWLHALRNSGATLSFKPRADSRPSRPAG